MLPYALPLPPGSKALPFYYSKRLPGMAWGNSQHTRNLRCMHDAPQDVLVESYPEEEFWQDLQRVTEGNTNEATARLVIRTSSQCRDWMRRHGVNFQPPLSGALHVARTNAFFMGGGKAP